MDIGSSLYQISESTAASSLEEEYINFSQSSSIDHTRFTSPAALNKIDRVIISVSKPKIIDHTLNKHAIYTVQGMDAKGNFEIERRYKDFTALRSVLIQHWPGCFIPQLPSKQMLGNLNPDFIEERRVILDFFLKRTSGFSPIYNSEEFQQFIRNSNDFYRLANEMKRRSFKDIADIYQNEFLDYYIDQVSHDNEQVIDNSYRAFKACLEVFEQFEEIIKRNQECYDRKMRENERLFRELNEINIKYSKCFGVREIRFQNVNKPVSPYKGLLDWIKLEILDLNAMIEAILRNYEYEKFLERAVEKLENEKSSMKCIQQNRKSFINFISMKSKEKKISHMENTILYSETDVNSLTIIRKILVSKQSKNDIPMFKTQKAKKYELALCRFFSSWIKDHLQLEDFLKSILQSLN